MKPNRWRAGPLPLPRLWDLLSLAGAALLSLLLYHYLPLAAEDPFRLFLAPWPLWLLFLHWIERRADAHAPVGQERRGQRAGRAMAFSALGLLLLLTLGRESLGLAVTDWFLAAGYLLFLGARTAQLLWRLRTRLGRRLPARPGWSFFLLPWVIYLALLPWSTDHRQPDGDEPYYLLLTHSLAHDFDTDLTNNYAAGDWRHFMEREIEPQSGDPVGPDGQLYSRHNSLLPLLLAPAYRIAGTWGVRILLAALTAALAWMLLRLAWHYAPEHPGASLLAYGLFAFSPPLLIYSQQVWIEVPAALLLALALDRLLMLAHPGRRRGRDLLFFALAIGLMPLLKLRLGLVAAMLLMLSWWRLRPGRIWLPRLAGLLAVGGGLLMLINQLRFGNPLKNHSWNEVALLLGPPERTLLSALGMFYDSAFGLFATAPVWLLLIPAAIVAWRQRATQLFHLLVLALPYALLLAPRLEWYGGWSPAFRYPLVFLPLLALLLIPLLADRRSPGLLGLVFALGCFSLVLSLIWLVIPGWTYNFADGGTHLLDRAGLRLGSDVGRLFPSSVRPRLATWLWPLLSLLIIPLALAGGRGKRLEGGGKAFRWGTGTLLLAATLVPFASAHWPTQRIELEDDFVAKDRGRPYPTRWTQGRAAFPGGWVLYSKTRVSAPVVNGSQRLLLRLRLRYVENVPDPFELRIAAGDAAGDNVLTTWRGNRDRTWQEVELGPFPWPPGADLVFLGPEENANPGKRNGLILDRVELQWQ